MSRLLQRLARSMTSIIHPEFSRAVLETCYRQLLGLRHPRHWDTTSCIIDCSPVPSPHLTWKQSSKEKNFKTDVSCKDKTYITKYQTTIISNQSDIDALEPLYQLKHLTPVCRLMSGNDHATRRINVHPGGMITLTFSNRHESIINVHNRQNTGVNDRWQQWRGCRCLL